MPTKRGQIRDIGIVIFLLVLGGLVVYHYQSQASSAEVPDTDTAIVTTGPELQAWQGGPHADTFVVGTNGENSTCARCHAPVNFVPKMDELPDSCLICKFEIEEAPPFIQQTEWRAVDCKTCHKIDQYGAIQPEYDWLEVAVMDDYADVDSTTELCQKCHTNADIVGHVEIVVGGTHADLDCTNCHDAHATTSSCSTGGCHETREDTAGHDDAHQIVSCVACHDADNLSVEPNEEAGGIWITFASTTIDEETSVFPHISHNLQRTVDCTRCHFADNPWDLLAEVAATP